jgi:hypothetical protein
MSQCFRHKAAWEHGDILVSSQRAYCNQSESLQSQFTHLFLHSGSTNTTGRWQGVLPASQVCLTWSVSFLVSDCWQALYNQCCSLFFMWLSQLLWFRCRQVYLECRTYQANISRLVVWDQDCRCMLGPPCSQLKSVFSAFSVLSCLWLVVTLIVFSPGLNSHSSTSQWKLGTKSTVRSNFTTYLSEIVNLWRLKTFMWNCAQC